MSWKLSKVMVQFHLIQVEIMDPMINNTLTKLMTLLLGYIYLIFQCQYVIVTFRRPTIKHVSHWPLPGQLRLQKFHLELDTIDSVSKVFSLGCQPGGAINANFSSRKSTCPHTSTILNMYSRGCNSRQKLTSAVTALELGVRYMSHNGDL